MPLPFLFAIRASSFSGREAAAARRVTQRAIGSVAAAALLLPLTVSASAQVTSGLIGEWTFNQSSGNTAVNSAGSSGNAPLYNFPTNNSEWVTGIIGKALHFRGPSSSDYAIASSYTQPTSSISFSGWVNAETNAVQWETIAKNWGQTQSGQFHFGIDDTSQKLSLYLTQSNGTTVSVFDPSTLTTGSWVQVGFTANAGTGIVSIYRNGAVVGTTTYNGTLLSSSIPTIGFGAKTDDTGTTAASGFPGYWQGSFDDFGLWNRSLTSTEMSQIYTKGLSGMGISSTAAPEPGTLPLILLGILGAAGAKRSHRIARRK